MPRGQVMPGGQGQVMPRGAGDARGAGGQGVPRGAGRAQAMPRGAERAQGGRACPGDAKGGRAWQAPACTGWSSAACGIAKGWAQLRQPVHCPCHASGFDACSPVHTVHTVYTSCRHALDKRWHVGRRRGGCSNGSRCTINAMRWAGH
eukprot:366466-Chlamydomonas_euryale.AAC.4